MEGKYWRKVVFVMCCMKVNVGIENLNLVVEELLIMNLDNVDGYVYLFLIVFIIILLIWERRVCSSNLLILSLWKK